MSGWPVATLGDVVKVNPRVGADRVSFDLPVSFVPMAAVSEQTGSIESSEVRTFGEVSKGFPIFSENDVLFAKITPCMENGKAAIARNLANGTGAGSTEFFVLRPTSKILSEYVFHFIRRTSFRVLCKANFTGSAGQQRVPKSFLEKVLIPLPPLDEQRRIVGVLNRTAEIKRRADAVRAKARAIIPALFLDTFGDPSTNPKGWPYAELSNVAEIGSGLTKGRKLNGQQTVPTPYLRVANVQDGYLQLSEIKSIEATAADLERCALRDGDLLMTEGGDADKLGRCAIWHEEIENCLHQNHIFRVRVGHKLLPDYTAAFIQSDAGKAYFLRVAKRTTGIASVNKTQLGALPVMMPPPALQTVFAEQAQRLQSLVRHLDAAATKAEAMAAAFAEEVFRSSQLGDHAKSLPASRPIDLPDRKLALISALKVRA